jgi:O6-methylguanine-DNA--protein-cysteine methyltransferase
MGLRGSGPNRAETFFQQVDANKKNAAKDAIATGSILGGVYNKGTQARKQEAANVGQQTTAVANTNTDFQDTKTGNVQSTVNQATPVVVPTVSAEGYNANQYVTSGQSTVTANPQNTDRGGRALDSSKVSYTTKDLNEGAAAQGSADYLAGELAKFTTETERQNALMNLLEGADEDIKAEVAADLERKGILDKTLLDAIKAGQTEKYGEIAQASQTDQNAADFMRRLAEQNPSNVGLLSMLYGGGYDAGKYGALDSNILQGQLNELRQEAEPALSERESAQNIMGQSVKDFYSTAEGKQKEVIDKYNAEVKETDSLGEASAKAKTQIQQNIEQLVNARATASTELKKQIDEKLAALRGDLKKLNAAEKGKAQSAADKDAKKRSEEAQKKKEADFSAKIRNKLGIELSPGQVAEAMRKYGDGLIDAIERGDTGGIVNNFVGWADPTGTLRGAMGGIQARGASSLANTTANVLGRNTRAGRPVATIAEGTNDIAKSSAQSKLVGKDSVVSNTGKTFRRLVK